VESNRTPHQLRYATPKPVYRWKYLLARAMLMTLSIVAGTGGGLLLMPAVLLARYSEGSLIQWACAIAVGLTGLLFFYVSIRILHVVDRMPAPEPPRYDAGDDPFPSEADGPS